MNLLYDEVEEDLRANLRKLLSERSDAASVLARCESDEPYDLALWRTLAGELGLTGLLVPESVGGAGASTRETAVVAEELGRSVTPVPFLGSAVLATSALLACGRDVSELLAGLAAGTTATLGVPLATAPDAAFPDTVQVVDGVLSGSVRGVVDLDVAETVVVPARADGRSALYALSLPAEGAQVEPVVSFDLTRRIADLRLDGVAARPLADPDEAEGALRSALRTGAGMLASEQLGVASWCLDETIEYVRLRRQFGRLIGSFQAVKHRLADVWAAVSSARAVARAAADALATGSDDIDVLVAVAAATCSDVAVHAAEECVQFHGGVGMTWEHPAHLYLARSKATQIALGTPVLHREALARLVALPA